MLYKLVWLKNIDAKGLFLLFWAEKHEIDRDEKKQNPVDVSNLYSIRSWFDIPIANYILKYNF